MTSQRRSLRSLGREEAFFLAGVLVGSLVTAAIMMRHSEFSLVTLKEGFEAAGGSRPPPAGAAHALATPGPGAAASKLTVAERLRPSPEAGGGAAAAAPRAKTASTKTRTTTTGGGPFVAFPAAGPEPSCQADGVSAKEAARRAAAGTAAGPPAQAGGSCTNLEQWARRTVAEQLSPWNETGITQAMHNYASNYEPRIGGSQNIGVRNGQVYGDNDWASYMKRAAEHWPFAREDLRDFAVTAGNADWPFMLKADPQASPARAGPALANAVNEHFWNVLMPVQSRPQFGSEFEGKRAAVLALGRRYPWKERKDLAVWRGNLGCAVGCGPRGEAYFPHNHLESCKDDSPHWDPNRVGFVYGCGDDKESKSGAWMRHYRVQLVRHSVHCAKECGVDAKFPDIGGEHRPFVVNYTGEKGISEWLGGYMDDEDSAKHRYVFHVGNNGYADRSWRMFALGSTVLLVDTGWREWFYSLLQPFVHYIPVKVDASDICEQLRWAREHPKDAEAIAERGRAFIEGCFDLKLVNRYCAEVMRQLGDLWEKGESRGKKR